MILLSGGAGYIGSHILISLIEKNYDVVVVDNFINSESESIKKVEEIVKRPIKNYEIDCRDEKKLERVFKENTITGCIHLAGLKAVGESNIIPLDYYSHNISSALAVLNLLKKYDVKRMIFSSSCTVYGNPKTVPVTENFSLSATNPYGRSKLMIEDVLRDLYVSDASWHMGILRYFNPIGAHESGKIGDKPTGIPNTLLPYIGKVARGILPYLSIFGDDYPTKDGTGVRDYIHVVDLAEGHVAMLDKLMKSQGIYTYNLGTGMGSSVFEIVTSYEEIIGQRIPYEIKPRRQGDVFESYANVSKASAGLGWTAKKDIKTMIQDAWRFETMNKQ